MVIKPGLDLDDLVKDDRVHYRVYIEPEIFQVEMDKIFGRTWIYVAHETEIREGGDYKTAVIGKRPVIVTRNPDDGRIQVLFNRCRHRGATVCQFETGNSSYFRCAYHGWTYNNTGKLVGVPYRQGYGPDFAPGDLGLVPAARVESYKGFIFASMNPDVPSLSDYLAGAKEYIDAWLSQSPAGRMQVKWGVTKYAYNGNWKMQMENTLDGYHFDFVHEDYEAVFLRRTGRKFQVPPEYWALDLGNGHAAIAVKGGSEPMIGPGFFLNVFPNLELLWTQVRVVYPQAHNRTDVALYYSVPDGLDDEVVRKRLIEHNDGFGPVSNIGPNDWELFERCQAGLGTRAEDWVIFYRGGKGESNDRIGGPARESESPQRAFYRQWRHLMAAG